MSRQLINEYRADLDQLKQVTGSRRETNLRPAFARLLRNWGKQFALVFVEEFQVRTVKGNLISIDGALKFLLGVPFGYWEAKDETDDLQKEIDDKFRRGYPASNTIFSDDVTAILWQDGREAMRAPMHDIDGLFDLLNRFFAHEREEVAEFNKAVKQFAADLPQVLEALRGIIQEKRASSSAFARAQDDFLKHARDAINPTVSEDDVQEMLIQHVLTEDIFAKVFDNPDFHQSNNIARELKRLEEALFGYGEKASLLRALAPYYSGIARTAASIPTHSEKQGFLKALYENFYKVYNPKAADKLGVVYTPGEIVRFMIRSADWLCEKHFGKSLIDRGVEILDPATGTGTFIVELLESFRGDREKLRHKYKEELHANEVAILPYYVANLNIEATYAAITGQFAEFENLCFVDTLDNVAALGIYSGHQADMFGGTSDENMGRIKRQNERKISVIIGNPPYNANQQNENDNNKNRTYQRIDERIKATYIKASNAQKTKLYDMYVRFFRWASDRLSDEGIVAFITNRSFIDAHTADGFRRVVGNEFAEGWIVDLGGDYKKKGVGGTGNVFDIGTGVAVSFWIKRKNHSGKIKLFYRSAPAGTGEDKLSWIANQRMDENGWQAIAHRHDAAWMDVPNENWNQFPLLAEKSSRNQSSSPNAIFRLFSLGIATNRDDWVYDKSRKQLKRKITKLITEYDAVSARPSVFPNVIKWSETLKRRKNVGESEATDWTKIRRACYRPFEKKAFYHSSVFIDRPGRSDKIFPLGHENRAICFSDISPRAPFTTHSVAEVHDLNYGGSIGGFQHVPRYRYTKSGERVDNITDWAVAQFRGAYANPRLEAAGTGGAGGAVQKAPAVAGSAQRADDATASDVRTPPPAAFGGGPPPPLGEDLDLGITKDAIFAYCYAVLHDPVYRETYALNLKREFPRIPFYPDFARWVAWGEALLALHIGYEDVAPFALTRTDTPAPKRAEGTHPKPKLKSIPGPSTGSGGTVVVDEDTQLSGIPRAAWDYRLGNRSAIDWVLDQHKEKTPRDPTIRAKFNTYRFADYKESMIDLLAKVVTVSVETVAISEAMRGARRG